MIQLATNIVNNCLSCVALQLRRNFVYIRNVEEIMWCILCYIVYLKSRSFIATSSCTAQLYLVHQFKLDETSEHYFCTSTSTYSEPDNCSSASSDALRLYCRAFPRLEPLVHPSPPHLSIRASQSVFFCIFRVIFPCNLPHFLISSYLFILFE